MSSSEEEEITSEETATPLTGKRVFRRAEDIQENQQSSNIWLISFTDVMALMLTFFVLLFSMTEPSKKDWSEVTAAMQSEFNRFYGSMARRGPQDTLNISKLNFDQALNIKYLQFLMQNIVNENESLDSVHVISQGTRLIISLPRDLLFEPGQAEVKEQGSRALYALGGALSRIKNKIEVIGHADPRPVSTVSAEYDTNWDLSLMRAVNVAGILERVGYQNNITIRGLSSGRYQDLEDTVEEQERLELSRRVDIVLLNHDGSRQKVFYAPRRK
jgi:chemotaxis protein MotB